MAVTNMEESLLRYGLHPEGAELDEVRGLLEEQTRLERGSQGHGDTELMRLCCVQLFHAGLLDDVMLIWRAKSSSMDAACSIDVQLLCGAGLPETKAFLAGLQSEEARSAWEWVRACEEAGDFEDFSVAAQSRQEGSYYA
ncbi:hypothetical protein ACQP1W_50815 [Spirillospora sp. CA-255316]